MNAKYGRINKKGLDNCQDLFYLFFRILHSLFNNIDIIRKLTQEEYNNAADLSYQVCMERNDFTQEGIETFKSFVYDTSLMNTLDIYGAFDNHLLIGIIGVHRERQHISLSLIHISEPTRPY